MEASASSSSVSTFDDTLLAGCATAVEEHWSLGSAHFVSVPTLQEAEFVPMSRYPSMTEVFMGFFTSPIWDVLVKATNTHLSDGTNCDYHDSRRKPTTKQELIKFYGIIIAMENSYGNDMKNQRTHFKDIKTAYGGVNKLGCDHFEALLHAFVPSLEQLGNICDLFHEAFINHLEKTSDALIDESVIGYQPSAAVKKHYEELGEPIPVVHIPRKPHPNGFLIYLIATFVRDPGQEQKHLPYILDLKPYLRQGEAGAIDALYHFLERWPEKFEKPHIISDSAFCSLEVLEVIHEWGGHATMACASDSSAWIWQILSYNLPPNHWHGLYQSDSRFLASCHALVDNNGKKQYQFILSNAFEVEPLDMQASVSTLQVSMPVFQLDALQAMKVDQLKKICKEYNIRYGKKKDQLVQNIYNRSATMHQDVTAVERMMTSIQTTSLADPAPLHNCYKQWFNLVDLVDRRWYAVEEHHGRHQWKTKMLLALLRMAVYNSWVYWNTFYPRDWLYYRQQLAQRLMKYESN